MQQPPQPVGSGPLRQLEGKPGSGAQNARIDRAQQPRIARAQKALEGQGTRSGPLEQPEAGATTAEYGIVMLAAVGFAGLLVLILKSDEVRQLLLNIVQSALSTGA